MKDFGVIRTEVNGMALEAKAIVPGMTLHDLVMMFDTASKSTNADSLAGNPSNWPVVLGVGAVVDAVLEALDKDERVGREQLRAAVFDALDASTLPGTCDVLALQKGAIRYDGEFKLDEFVNAVFVGKNDKTG